MNELPGRIYYRALRLMCEVGVDLCPFPKGEHYTRWLKLALCKKQLGKHFRKHLNKSAPRATEIFNQAAQILLDPCPWRL